jgi:hypothetical protein
VARAFVLAVPFVTPLFRSFSMRLFVVFAIWILTLSEASAGVIIDYIGVQAGIWNQSKNNWDANSDTLAGNDLGIPVSTGISNLNKPSSPNTSRVAFDFQQHGQNATIDFYWDHSISGVTKDEAYGYAYAAFTPDVDLRYEISGAYSVNGAAASYQQTEIFSDFNPPFALSYKESRSTLNETLVVGSPLGGDFKNAVEGSFTGVLNAGQQYSIFNRWYLHAYSDAAPSTATGNLRLSLSPLNSAAVPEPSSLLFMGIGACGLFARVRRMKRHTA